MSDRKLSLKPLRPNGTPRKIAISLDHELAEELDLYATAYADEYQAEAEIDALIIPIIRAFLERDRLFQKWKREQQRDPTPPRKPPRKSHLSAPISPAQTEASATIDAAIGQ